jgi:hypothetical protein
MSIDLPKVIEEIRARGPTRVMVSSAGYCAPPGEALERYGIVPEIILIRDDGWSLGTPRKWLEWAMKLWRDYWVCRIELTPKSDGEKEL